MIPIPAPLLGFFASYWKLIAVALLIASAYVKGCSDEKERFDEYKALVTAVGQAQERWAAAHRTAQKALTSRMEKAYEMDLALLRHSNAGLAEQLRLATTSTRIVPSVPDTATGDLKPSLSCFEGDQLDAGIQLALGKLLAGITGLFQKCAESALEGRACAAWVLEQWKLETRPASP